MVSLRPSFWCNLISLSVIYSLASSVNHLVNEEIIIGDIFRCFRHHYRYILVGALTSYKNSFRSRLYKCELWEVWGGACIIIGGGYLYYGSADMVLDMRLYMLPSDTYSKVLGSILVATGIDVYGFVRLSRASIDLYQDK